MAATPKQTSKRRGTKRKSTTTQTQTQTQTHFNSTISPLIPAVASALSASHSFLLSHDLHLLPSHSLALESSISSASLSLSNLQSLFQVKPQFTSFLSSQDSVWFERFLFSASADGDPRWVQTFRMSRPTFCLLNSTLSPSLRSFLPSVPPNFALGAALYRLAHGGSFSSIGPRFGLSTKDACRAFYSVCKVICDQLGFYLGEFGLEMERILVGFEQISLPNCCGVLGVEKFPVEGELLGNKGFLMVQALVDSDGRFLDVSAGWPSTFTPNTILRQTRLYSGVEESKELLSGLMFELIDGNLLPQYVLGDSCYPLLPWLLTPFAKRGKGKDLSLKEMEFNDLHKRAMGLVRVAFRRVRANWQLFNRIWKQESIEFLPFIIMTACLLNNFLMKHGETLMDGELSYVGEQESSVCVDEADETARRTRDVLALHLSRVNQRI